MLVLPLSRPEFAHGVQFPLEDMGYRLFRQDKDYAPF